MLIFSTKLTVTETLTENRLIQYVITWLNDNRNYHFHGLTYNGEENYIVETGYENLEIVQYPEALIIRLVSHSKGVIWTNDYVLKKGEGQRVLAIQLYSDAENLSVRMPQTFNKPRLLKQIVADGYGGKDQDIVVSNKPLLITENNIELARDLILRKKSYFMPLVYVTYPRYAIDMPIDYNGMAFNLAGIAHVIVESKEMAPNVRKATNGANPYAGAVEIFYGTNSSYRMLPDDFDTLGEMQEAIEKTVQQRLLMTKIDDDLSWNKIRFTHIQQKKEQDPELSEIFEQLLKEEEEKGNYKNQHIEELELHIMELEERVKDQRAELNNKENRIQSYEYILRHKGDNAANRIVLEVSEKELYEGEIKDVILRVLDKEKGQLNNGLNLTSSRKFHVLNDITRLNHQTGKAEEISNWLREIIDDSGNLNTQRKRQLMEAGFQIDTGTHYKITYNEDCRYTFTLAKTPGDYRTNMNTIKDATAALFGR